MGISPFQYDEMQSRLNRNKIRDPAAPENAVDDEVDELHKPILQWAKEKIPFIPVLYHRPDKRSGLTKGAHDLTVFYKGHAICGEGKSKTGKRSVDQIAWSLAMEKQGFIVNIWHHPSEFFQIISAIDKSERAQQMTTS